MFVFLTTRSSTCTNSQNSCIVLVNYNQVFLILSQFVIGRAWFFIVPISLVTQKERYSSTYHAHLCTVWSEPVDNRSVPSPRRYGYRCWRCKYSFQSAVHLLTSRQWASFSVPAAMAAEIPLQYIGCNSSMDQKQCVLVIYTWFALISSLRADRKRPTPLTLFLLTDTQFSLWRGLGSWSLMHWCFLSFFTNLLFCHEAATKLSWVRCCVTVSLVWNCFCFSAWIFPSQGLSTLRRSHFTG